MRQASVSGVDQEADHKVTVLRRLGTVERVAHRHPGGLGIGAGNLIHNGGFDIWQRGGGAFVTGFGADRWNNVVNVSTISTTRQSFAATDPWIDGQEQARWYQESIVAAGAGADAFAFIAQSLETVRSCAGKTVTLSWWMRADTAGKVVAIELQQYFGAGGAPSATVTGIGQQLVELTDEWARYSVTIDVPSIQGKVIGTDNSDNLRVAFVYDAGATYATRFANMPRQNGTFHIWGVQLEEGSGVTAWDPRPLQTELLICMRYLQRLTITSGVNGPNGLFLMGFAANTTVAVFIYAFKVPMRIVNPAVSHNGVASFQVTDYIGAVVSTAVGVNAANASDDAYLFEVSVAAGLTAFRPYALRGVNASSFIQFSAEI